MKRMTSKARKSRYAIMGIIFVGAVLISLPVSSHSAPSPIKIGILYPFTGPIAREGNRMLRGWEISLEQANYAVAGRPIQLVIEDTKGDPSVGVTKTTKLIEKDGVHILGGLVSSAVAYAIRDIVDRSKIPLVITMANAGALTRERRSPYIFRTYPPGGTPSHYMADFIYNDLKLRKAIFSGTDYAYGREHGATFKKAFEKLGGEVVFEIYAPLGTADFAPYVTKIADFAGKADVLHFVYSGSDGINFVKTAADFGLNKKFTLTNWGATTDGIAVNQMGASAEGIYMITIYFLGMKTEANQRFLELNKRKGLPLDNLDYAGYVGAEVVLHALQQVQGNVEAKDEFLKALRGVKFEHVSGPFAFDPRSQNALVNFAFTRVARTDGEFGKYQNVFIKTIFQTQDPWWLEHPQGQ